MLRLIGKRQERVCFFHFIYHVILYLNLTKYDFSAVCCFQLLIKIAKCWHCLVLFLSPWGWAWLCSAKSCADVSEMKLAWWHPGVLFGAGNHFMEVLSADGWFLEFFTYTCTLVEIVYNTYIFSPKNPGFLLKYWPSQ